VCVPTLQEEGEIGSLLDHLRGLSGRWEIVVADGGSADLTVAVARGHPLRPRVILCCGGRAAQLNAAAALATGAILVFLHADSRLPDDAHASLCAAVGDATVVGGNFALRFEGSDPFARLLTAVYGLQRRHGFYYGDSSVWVRRETFSELGGYRELAIMDDYDFVRRLERMPAPARTVLLGGPATTSSRRWRRLGIARTLLAWVVIRWLYVAGVSPDRLARLYRRVR